VIIAAAELLEAMAEFAVMLTADMEQWSAAARSRPKGKGYGLSYPLLLMWRTFVQMLIKAQLDEAAELVALISAPAMCRLALAMLHGPGFLHLVFLIQITQLISRPPSLKAKHAVAQQQLLRSPHVHSFLVTAFTVLAHYVGLQRPRTHARAWDVPPLTQHRQQPQQQQRQERRQQRRQQRRQRRRQPSGTPAAASDELAQAPSATTALKALPQLGCIIRTSLMDGDHPAGSQAPITYLCACADSLLILWLGATVGDDVAIFRDDKTMCLYTTLLTNPVRTNHQPADVDCSSGRVCSIADADFQRADMISALHCMTRDDAHWLLCVCGQAAQAALVGSLQQRSDLLLHLLRIALALVTTDSRPCSMTVEAPQPAAEQQQQQQHSPGSQGCGMTVNAPGGDGSSSCMAGCGSGAAAAAATTDNSSASSASTTSSNRTGIGGWFNEPLAGQDVAAAVLLDIGPVLLDFVEESKINPDGVVCGHVRACMQAFVRVIVQLCARSVTGDMAEADARRRLDLTGVQQVVASAPLTAARMLELVLRSTALDGCAGQSEHKQARMTPVQEAVDFRIFAHYVARCFIQVMQQWTADFSSGRASSVINAQHGALLEPQLGCLLLTVVKAMRLDLAQAEDSNKTDGIQGMVMASNAVSRQLIINMVNHAAAVDRAPPDAPGITHSTILLAALRALLLLGDTLQYRYLEILQNMSVGPLMSDISSNAADVQQLLQKDGGAYLLPALRGTGSSDGGSSSSSSSSASAGVGATRAAVTAACEALQSILAGMQPGVACSEEQWNKIGRHLVSYAQHALALLPSPLCCNNPACVNLEETAEWQLVSRRGSMCAGCRTARYCCTACQRAHWAMHKPVCKALKEALADGGYVSPSGYIGVSRVVKL
jgi:MYND finger